MEEIKPESFRNYLRLTVLLKGYGFAALQEILEDRYQQLTQKKWEDGSLHAKEFLQGLYSTPPTSTSPVPLKKEMLEGADLSRLDLLGLAWLLQNLDLTPLSAAQRLRYEDQNVHVNELEILWGKFLDLPSKSVDAEDFADLWKLAKTQLVSLGFSVDKIDELNVAHLDEIELENAPGRPEQMLKAKKLRDAGNALMRKKEYYRAVQKYSQALLIHGLSSIERGLLHSNRCHAYLKALMETSFSKEKEAEIQSLALRDAEEVMELRPTWWKGYFRTGRVHQYGGDWELAINLFDQALALKPGLEEVVKNQEDCRLKLDLSMGLAILKSATDNVGEGHGEVAEEEGKISEDNEVEEGMDELNEIVRTKTWRVPCMTMDGFAYTLDRVPDPVEKFWSNMSEITQRAEAGYPYAKRTIKSMGFFQKGLEELKIIANSEAPTNMQKEQCILNIADSFNTAVIVAYFDPPKLVNVLKDICETKMTGGKSDLDVAARICYSYTMSYSEKPVKEWLAFAKRSYEKYPDIEYFYYVYIQALNVSKDHKAALKISDEGLRRWRGSSELVHRNLWCRQQIRSADPADVCEYNYMYKVFLKLAPFDDPKVAEIFYIRSFSTHFKDTGEWKACLSKAMEIEEKLPPCFTPIDLDSKKYVQVLMKMKARGIKAKQMEMEAKAVEASPAKGTLDEAAMMEQLTNPVRVDCVVRHREFVKTISEFCEGWSCDVLPSVHPTFCEKGTTDMTSYAEIKLKDMAPGKEHLYENRFINLLVADDPMVGSYPAFRVIVRDDNGDCINCSFYELDHTSSIIRSGLSFGSGITIANPHYRVAADCSVSLRVDDPKNIIYRWSGREAPICRFCWKVNPEKSCGMCKRVKYCGRACQVKDWEILKHRLVCKLRYFDGGMNSFFA